MRNLLDRMYQNQLTLEAALVELTLHVEKSGFSETSENVRGSLHTIGKNAGNIKQALAKLKSKKKKSD
jgi:hypothetical protein